MFQLNEREELSTFDFLSVLFNGKELIEIREIGDRVSQRFYTLDQAIFYKPPIDKNVYFGVYSRAGKKGTSESCITTGTLWLDFDNITLAEIRERLNSAELPSPSIIINSGHGFHTYWLLTERAGNEALPVIKKMAAVVKADLKATDKARLMRLPGSVNIKDRERPVPCRIVEADFNKRYPLSSFYEVLKVKQEPKREKLSVSDSTPTNAAHKRDIKELLNSKRFCIQVSAYGVRQGQRNFWLGRIVKELQQRGLKRKDTWEVVVKWNRNNEPPEAFNKLKSDFESFWKGNYKLLGCTINNPELRNVLAGSCERHKCKFSNAIYNIDFENSVAYNNHIFNEFYKVNGNDLIVWGTLLRYEEGLTTSQLLEKLTGTKINKPCISRNTLSRCMDRLIRQKLVDCTLGIPQRGKENFYQAKKKGTFTQGYTLCSYEALNGVIEGIITATEFKVYVQLLEYSFTKVSCFPSLKTLDEKLRMGRANISHHLNALEKAGYLKRTYKAFEKKPDKFFITLKK